MTLLVAASLAQWVSAQEIGLQLYSLRNQFKTDVPGTLAKIKTWNIKEIEGKWSKPDGSKETDFLVSQQPIEFSAAVKILPRDCRTLSSPAR